MEKYLRKREQNPQRERRRTWNKHKGTQEEDRCGHRGGGPTGKQASGDKIHVVLQERSFRRDGAQAKLQNIMNYWIVKANYSLELLRNFTGEGRKNAGNLRSITESSLW